MNSMEPPPTIAQLPRAPSLNDLLTTMTGWRSFSRTDGDAVDTNRTEQTAGIQMDELASSGSDAQMDAVMQNEITQLCFKLQNVAPFFILLLLMFLHEHVVSIMFFLLSSSILMQADQRFRKQVALKENTQPIVITTLIIISSTQIVSSYLLFQRDPQWRALLINPLSPISEDISFWQVLYGVGVNDFCVRFLSIAFKCVVLITSFERCQIPRKPGERAGGGERSSGGGGAGGGEESSGSSSLIGGTNCGDDNHDDHDDDGSDQRFMRSRSALMALQRKKRYMFAILEGVSLAYRHLLAMVPWCVFYLHAPSTQYAGIFFAGTYATFKLLVVAQQLKTLSRVAKALLSVQLEFGRYAVYPSLS
jgi:hypothetical protein